MPRKTRTLLSAFLTLVLFSGALPARTHIAPGSALELLLHCAPFDAKQGRCDLRLRQAKAMLDFEARLGEIQLPKPRFIPYPQPGDTSAILFLVDTSDPGRGSVVAENAGQIRKLLAQGKSHQRFGLARFDADYHLLSPPGSSPKQLGKAIQGLRASGRTTELYRSALQALDTLASYPAQRKALFIFSDGMAEDHAYFHHDVVEKARQHQISIYGLGFARSVSQSVALQTLRRLSDETGGLFLAADPKLHLATDFMAAPFATLERGGHILLDLSAATSTDPGDGLPLTVVAHTAGTSYAATVKVHLPPPPPVPVSVAISAPAPEAIAAPGPLATPAPTPVAIRPPPAPTRMSAPRTSDEINPLLWISLLGAFALVGGALAFLRGRGRTDSPLPKTTPKPKSVPKVQAFVELRDGTERHVEIDGDCFRMGRHSDNDLTLEDSSLSRHHAEIRRQQEGSFRLTDLNSLNGVYVNGVPVDTAIIKDGDMLELGDVGMVFGTVSVHDDEVTRMVKSTASRIQTATDTEDETELNNG